MKLKYLIMAIVITAIVAVKSFAACTCGIAPTSGSTPVVLGPGGNATFTVNWQLDTLCEAMPCVKTLLAYAKEKDLFSLSDGGIVHSSGGAHVQMLSSSYSPSFDSTNWKVKFTGSSTCLFTYNAVFDSLSTNLNYNIYWFGPRYGSGTVTGVANVKIRNRPKHPDPCDNRGNPVSARMGNKIVNETDNNSGKLYFTREYNKGPILKEDTLATLAWKRPFGNSDWRHNWNIYIRPVVTSDTFVLFVNGIKEWNTFLKRQSDSLHRSERSSGATVKKLANGWRLTNQDGSKYWFNSSGRIDSITNYSKRTHLFSYDTTTNGRLTTVADEYGDSLHLRYDPSNNYRLTKVFSDSAQEYVTYQYDSTRSGINLVQVVGHYPAITTVDSVKVLSRYFYAGRYYMTQPADTSTLYSGDMSIYQRGINFKYLTYSQDSTRERAGDRTCLWYNSKKQVVYQEIIKGDTVNTSLSDDGVTYRAYFEYFIGDTSTYDSTVVYYFEGAAFTGAHDPYNKQFKPEDSIASWKASNKYYKETIVYNKNGTKNRVKYFNPTTNSNDSTVYLSYDRNYNPGTVTDPNGGVTYYTYQAYKNPGDTSTRYWPNPKVVKYPNGDSVLTYFSAKGDSNYRLPDSTIDEMGKRTFHYYDASNNYADTATVYKNRVLADGEGSSHDVAQRFHYNSQGNLTETLDPLDNKIKMYYSDSDTGMYLCEQRLVMSGTDTSSSDIVTKYGYNLAQGTLDTMTFYRDYPNSPSNTYYTYDVNKRLVKTVYPDTAKDSMTYDLRGNMLKKFTIKADTLYKAEYEYDPHDHLTKLKEYRSPNDSANAYDSTLYTYNLHDRMNSQTNALGQTTSYTYCMDRLVKVAYPDSACDSLGYWPGGDLKFKKDRKGQVTYFQYDGYSSGCGCMSSSRSRLAKKYYYDSLDQYVNGFNYPSDSVIYEYDKVGNRTKMVDKYGTTVYSYDGLYRLQSDSCGSLNTKIWYQYDQAGNRTRMTVCKGDSTICYLDQNYGNYDAANRVGRTIATGDTFDLTYWDTGTPKEAQYPNGAKEVYGLNVRGSLDSITTTLGDTLTWFKHKYGYNGLGDREWQYVYQTRPGTSALSDTFKYSYDGLRRLTGFICPPGTNNADTVGYTYDATGNRLERQSTYSGTKSYAIDNATNRMTQAGHYMNYDANGNWTRKWHGDDPVVDFDLTYDFENRLCSVTGTGYGAYYMTSYYNGDGVRLAKSTNADLSKIYVVDGMNTVVEQDGGGSLRHKYIYVNGMLFSKIDASDNKKYYHHDGLGSIVGISNSTPEVTTAQLFDDFGNWLYYDSNWDYYSYTGQEYDWPLTDAFNLRAREYYPEYGRFMQEDPIGNQGGSLNWYLYVANNPINFIDPEGFSKCTREEMNSEITKIKNIAIKWAKSIPYAERPFCGNLARDFERLINKSDFKCCNFTDVKTVGILKFQHNLTKIECSSCDNNNSTFCVDAWYRSSPIRACPNNATPTGWWQ